MTDTYRSSGLPTPIEQDPFKADFRNFLFLCWEHLNLPEPTPEQYDIAEYLQNGPRKKMIMAFRGVGKSWVYGAFSAWRLYCNPDWKIVCVSGSKAAADALAQFVKRLIDEMPLLQHLRPDTRKGQRDSVNVFDVGPARVSKDPSFKSVGITGQITGSRSDETIADDIETLNNSLTQAGRDRLLEAIKEFQAIAKPETGFITYLGTPQTEQSIYNSLPERGYEIRVWPARIPEDPDKYRGRLAPFVLDKIARGAHPGTPISPRFNDDKLTEALVEYGRAGFALQYMLDTSLSDAERYPLKLADLIVMALDPTIAPTRIMWSNDRHDVINDLTTVGLAGDRYYAPGWRSPEKAEFTGCVMTIDPSGRGSDETTYAIVKVLHGLQYVVAWGGYKEGYSAATLQGLATKAAEHRVNRILVEANFGDGMFTELLKPVLARIHPCAVEEVRHSTQKERRIADTLEPVLAQHRLVVDRRAIEEDAKREPIRQLMYQMTRLTRDKGCLRHDDMIDVLSMAVGYWAQHMARDQQQAHQDHQEALRDAELERFVQIFTGPDATGSADVWFDL